MKYIVKKEMPGAKVGDILVDDINGNLAAGGISIVVVGWPLTQAALDQGFIEPYEEKPRRWRAEGGGMFYGIGATPRISTHNHIAAESFTDTFDDPMHELGNYFKSKETAETVAEALRLLFEWLHTPVPNNSGYVDKLFSKMNDRMNEARHRVLADNEAGDE